jgi:cyclic pyranopterin phosphate synthase
MPRKLTHVTAEGRPGMVDVGAKRTSRRRALASARVVFPAHVARTLRAGEWKSAKGSVLDTAIIAGTMAVKKTHELIPFCHPLADRWLSLLDRTRAPITHAA